MGRAGRQAPLGRGTGDLPPMLFRALRLVHGHACSSGFLQLRKKRPLLAPDTGKFKGGAGFRLGGAGLHSLQQCFQDLLAHSPAPDSASLAVASSSGGPD